MSEPLRQSWVAKGAIFNDQGYIVLDFGRAAPTASAANYAVGAIYINTSGSLGTLVYVNTGTATSATWTNLI